MATEVNDRLILQKAVRMNELLTDGSTFELDTDFNPLDEEEDLFFELDTDTNEEVYEPIPSPWDKTFDELRQQMIKLPDLNIYKRIASKGHGTEPLPPKARITIDYNAYLENEQFAYDSSSLRGQPLVFYLTEGNILPGIELAVQTMKVGEESQFVISHEYLLGEMGCPPRIKPKADVLFIIKLISFIETGDENAMENVLHDDQRKYSVIKSKIQEIRNCAKERFKLNRTVDAIRLFNKAVDKLERCQVRNAEEQEEQQQEIITLYLNLAICYNKIDKPNMACLMCNEIGRICDIMKNCKASFQHGRALMKLGDYGRARRLLENAKRLEPQNDAIAKELKKLDEIVGRNRSTEMEFCKRVFSCKDIIKANENSNNGKKGDKPRNAELFDGLMPMIDEFLANSKVRHLPLPDGITHEELSWIRDLTESLSLTIQSEEHDNKTKYRLVK